MSKTVRGHRHDHSPSGMEILCRDFDKVFGWTVTSCIKFDKSIFKTTLVICTDWRMRSLSSSPEEKNLEILVDRSSV